MARIRADVERSRRDARAAVRLRERAEGIRVKGSSRGREVSVEIDVAGRLLGVSFLPASEDLSRRGLSDAVMMALADARRRAGEQVRLVVDETLGADSALGRQVLESYRQDQGADDGVQRQRSGDSQPRRDGGEGRDGRSAWMVSPMPVRPAQWGDPKGPGRR
ncbi:YbaB/EbfC family nucleoid-associated protein [Actinomyces sp.]|uniref:YbaB/EbfC family nucleoid-associated protein n=1 Tax=Actinomyces sp. TaxID=29317 RepID=UPI0026DD8B3A|nr:YbaB/EbfC family nucleoid-associated protein [Actinomyces sp.]MDO4900698.1 YbaB/EbfC family nucleoid-associated protein [Actinomyces sp.]